MRDNRKYDFDDEEAVPLKRSAKSKSQLSVSEKEYKKAPERQQNIQTAEKKYSDTIYRNKKSTEKNIYDKKRHGFGLFYAIFASILAVLSISAVIYVGCVLKDFEASQPEVIAKNCAEKIQRAAKDNKLSEVLSFEKVKKEMTLSREDIESFEKELAEGTLTVKRADDSAEDNTVCYNIICDNYATVAKLKMKSTGQKTTLAIFTNDIWVTEIPEATLYSAEMTLPPSLTVLADGKEIEGTVLDDKKNVSYTVRSVMRPEIVITDALGNSVSYTDDGKYSFREYTVTVPTSYTLRGKSDIPLSLAEITPIDELANVYVYFPDAPSLAHYDLFVMDGDYSLSVIDELGSEADISEMGNDIKITSFRGEDTMPQNIEKPPDPLEIAKLWSNFMTDDIGGAKHGFGTMSKYLFKGSPQYERALEWATSVDITFTSRHTLSNPPFTTETVKNFVSYDDRCFSCEIVLEKPLHIVTGDIVDKIHNIFYFGYIDDTDNGKDDPHWGIIDTVGVIS